MKSFFENVNEMEGINLKEPQNSKVDDKDSKGQFDQFLRSEVGDQVDITWKTAFFFLSFTVKSEDIGHILYILNKANLTRFID